MRVLGIDPGTATTGYGVVLKQGAALRSVAHGVIRTPSTDTPPARIQFIYEAVCGLMDVHHPDALATERLFFSRNETTAFSVGRTIGVVLLAASLRDLPWFEYTPMQVKQAVVGYGAADKKQIQYMIQRLLDLDQAPKPDDAADALAVAVCHAHSCGPLASPT